MLLPHFSKSCASCLKEPPFPDGKPLTKEHVVPRMLGGILHCAFLCLSCNKQYGHTFERKTRADPAIRLAIYKLRSELPELYKKIERDQPQLSRASGESCPDLRGGVTLTPLISLKIAYEFAVLSFGDVMLADDNPALREIRRALIQGDAGSPVFNVEEMMAKERQPQAFHGIAFEGNDPYAVIQVRLFGYLAYRVHFPNLAIDHKPFGYTHDLRYGTERLDPRNALK